MIFLNSRADVAGFLLGAFMFMALACSSPPKSGPQLEPFSEESVVFEQYMLSQFQQPLPDTLTHYIIVPRDIGCVGCKNGAFRYFKEKLLTHNCVLIGNPYIQDEIQDQDFGYKYFIDEVGKIERLRLKTQSVAVIKVAGHKIIDIVEVGPGNLVDVLRGLSAN